MHEVPRPQRAFASLDEQRALAAEYKEVLLPGFVVVQRHWSAWVKPVQADSEVVEMSLAIAAKAAHRSHVVVKPPRVAHVQDEPSGGDGHPGLKCCLGHRATSKSRTTTCPRILTVQST